MLSQVDPLVTDVGVVAAVLVAVVGAIKAIAVPFRRGLQMLDRIEAELTVNGGGSTKDVVKEIGRIVQEIQAEQLQVRLRLDIIERKEASA